MSEATLVNALRNVRMFLDVHVRAMLPNEHGNCAIDSRCSHGAAERENFEALDGMVEYIGKVLPERSEAP